MNEAGLTEEQIERFDDITQRIIDLRNRIAALEEQKDALTAELRDSLKVSDNVYTFDHATVRVTQKTAFSPDKAELLISPTMLPLVQVTETKIDDSRCKDLLPPELYRECRIPHGKPTVTVKEIE